MISQKKKKIKWDSVGKCFFFTAFSWFSGLFCGKVKEKGGVTMLVKKRNFERFEDFEVGHRFNKKILLHFENSV